MPRRTPQDPFDAGRLADTFTAIAPI